MEKTLSELKLEADSLGIRYSPNIGADRLKEKINEYYEKESKENSGPIEQFVDTEEVSNKEIKTTKNITRDEALRIIKQQERENSKPVVVKITVVDKREASTATEAYFNNGDYAMRVPLDTYVEMPLILVKMAEEAQALIHIETDKGAVPKMVKKYVVEYKK